MLAQKGFEELRDKIVEAWGKLERASRIDLENPVKEQNGPKTICVWEAARRWCNAKNNCHTCNQKHPHECPVCGDCAYLIEDGDTMTCGMYDREVRAFVEKKK